MFYKRQAETLTAEIRRLRKRNTGFVVSELLTFGLAIAAVVAYVSTDTGYTYLYIAAVMLVAYILIRRADINNANRITQQEDMRSVYQKELAYLSGDFSGFGDGAPYSNPQHPYTFDMDIFGRDSLFNRVNRTITSGGSDKLAKELMTLGCENIMQRQEAIRELAEQEPLCSRFLAYGQRKTINTSDILTTLHGIEQPSHTGEWRGEYLHQVEDWIEAVSHFDMLVSMATFRYNEPTAIDAEIIDNQEPLVLEAQAITHPFLGERAISNDFTLQDSHYYIITGANMAGKSTFLRTIGVNYILARCGMPVFAKRFRASRFSLFSSMRTTDDLTQGISYFNAELLRLQQLIEFCRNQPHTLIILDEILKGTNSLDKLNGSRLFLEHIRQLPVTGIIATHDLALSKMADEHPDRFHNYCFEIELSDNVTYTYKITEGVARNQNATFLLQNIVLSE